MRDIGHETEPLTEEAARDLLREKGYDLCRRFDHVHATTEAGEELHICCISELASMSRYCFLMCLEEAKKQTLRSLFVQMQQKQLKR